MTSMDYATHSPLWRLLSGGLNCQVVWCGQPLLASPAAAAPPLLQDNTTLAAAFAIVVVLRRVRLSVSIAMQQFLDRMQHDTRLPVEDVVAELARSTASTVCAASMAHVTPLRRATKAKRQLYSASPAHTSVARTRVITCQGLVCAENAALERKLIMLQSRLQTQLQQLRALREVHVGQLLRLVGVLHGDMVQVVAIRPPRQHDIEHETRLEEEAHAAVAKGAVVLPTLSFGVQVIVQYVCREPRKAADPLVEGPFVLPHVVFTKPLAPHHVRASVGTIHQHVELKMLADSLSDLNPNYPKAWQLVLGGVEAHAATAAAVAVWRAGRVALDIQACVRAPQPMEDCTGFGLITRAQRLDCVFLGDDVSDKMVVRLLALCPAARCFLRNLVRVDGPCVEVAGVAFDFTTREETEDGDLILKHSDDAKRTQFQRAALQRITLEHMSTGRIAGAGAGAGVGAGAGAATMRGGAYRKPWSPSQTLHRGHPLRTAKRRRPLQRRQVGLSNVLTPASSVSSVATNTPTARAPFSLAVSPYTPLPPNNQSASTPVSTPASTERRVGTGTSGIGGVPIRRGNARGETPGSVLSVLSCMSAATADDGDACM